MIKILQLTFAFLLISMSAPSAQERAAQDVIRDMSNRAAAMEIVLNLERLAGRLYYVESTALLSNTGAWPEEVAGETFNKDITKFFYDVFNLKVRLSTDLVAIKRSASRNGVLSDTERAEVMALINNLQEMLDETQEYYAILAANKFEQANNFFYEEIRPPYRNTMNRTYSLGSEIKRDIGKLSAEARFLK